MDNQFLHNTAPDESWCKLHETHLSPFVLENIIAMYQQYGFDLYAYNTGQRKTLKKYDEVRIWIYYKKFDKTKEKIKKE